MPHDGEQSHRERKGIELEGLHGDSCAAHARPHLEVQETEPKASHERGIGLQKQWKNEEEKDDRKGKRKKLR